MPSNIIGTKITYHCEEEEFTGYYAYDSNIKDERPGVLIVHEMWGFSDYVKNRADQLAELGYAAFALDMYGSNKTSDNPAQAQALMMEVNNNPALMQARFTAAQKVLQAQPQTLADKVAAIGYCFGGRVVLGMARAGVDLAAVVSFHGILKTQHTLTKETFAGKIAVYTGEKDPLVPHDDITNFIEEMNEAEADYSIKIYPNATHAFTNPTATKRGEETGAPLKYDAEADLDSWQGMQEVFVKAFE